MKQNCICKVNILSTWWFHKPWIIVQFYVWNGLVYIVFGQDLEFILLDRKSQDLNSCVDWMMAWSMSKFCLTCCLNQWLVYECYT
jgi:hypothetical protein